MRMFIALVLAVVVSGCGMETVSTYEAAIKRNVFTGGVHEDVHGQGLHFAPFHSWTTFDLREIQHPAGDASDILDVLTLDELRINVDAAFRYRVNAESVRELYLQTGGPAEVHAMVYNAFRSGVRDAVSTLSARSLMSEERSELEPRIRRRMEQVLEPRGVVLTEFYLRGIDPPGSYRQAVEARLSAEQRVEAEQHQTSIIEEQANQRRAEAEGIRDAQQIIAESLTGASGQAYLAYEGLQALKEAAQGENNLIIAPSEGGIPLMRPIQ